MNAVYNTISPSYMDQVDKDSLVLPRLHSEGPSNNENAHDSRTDHEFQSSLYSTETNSQQEKYNEEKFLSRMRRRPSSNLLELSIFCMRIVKYLVTPPLIHLPLLQYIPHQRENSRRRSFGSSNTPYIDPKQHTRQINIFMINIFEDENLMKQYSTVDTNQSQKIIEDTINV